MRICFTDWNGKRTNISQGGYGFFVVGEQALQIKSLRSYLRIEPTRLTHS